MTTRRKTNIIRITGIAGGVVLLFGWAAGQAPNGNLSEDFRMVEVASVSDAIEQLYGQKAYLSHDMRPVFRTKFAGPAVTILMKKEEKSISADTH